MTDAIVRALWRMAISHRNLLEWETAADADRRLGGSLRGFVRKLGPSSALAILLLMIPALNSPERMSFGLLLAALWAAAPARRVARIAH